MGGDEAIRQYDICRGETLKCMNDILNRMGGFDNSTNNLISQFKF